MSACEQAGPMPCTPRACTFAEPVPSSQCAVSFHMHMYGCTQPIIHPPRQALHAALMSHKEHCVLLVPPTRQHMQLYAPQSLCTLHAEGSKVLYLNPQPQNTLSQVTAHSHMKSIWLHAL